MQWIVLKHILIKWNQAHFLVIVRMTWTACCVIKSPARDLSPKKTFKPHSPQENQLHSESGEMIFLDSVGRPLIYSSIFVCLVILWGGNNFSSTLKAAKGGSFISKGIYPHLSFYCISFIVWNKMENHDHSSEPQKIPYTSHVCETQGTQRGFTTQESQAHSPFDIEIYTTFCSTFQNRSSKNV